MPAPVTAAPQARPGPGPPSMWRDCGTPPPHVVTEAGSPSTCSGPRRRSCEDYAGGIPETTLRLSGALLRS